LLHSFHGQLLFLQGGRVYKNCGGLLFLGFIIPLGHPPVHHPSTVAAVTTPFPKALPKTPRGLHYRFHHTKFFK